MFHELESLIDAASAIDVGHGSAESSVAENNASTTRQPSGLVAPSNVDDCVSATSQCLIPAQAHCAKSPASNRCDAAGRRVSHDAHLQGLNEMPIAASAAALSRVQRSNSDSSIGAIVKLSLQSNDAASCPDRLPGVAALLKLADSPPFAFSATSTASARPVAKAESAKPRGHADAQKPAAASAQPVPAGAQSVSSFVRLQGKLAMEGRTRPKIPRKRISAEQTRTLQNLFDEGMHFPSRALRDRLAAELSLQSRTIQVWFQNRRQSARNRLRNDEKPVGARRLSIRWMKPVIFHDAAAAQSDNTAALLDCSSSDSQSSTEAVGACPKETGAPNDQVSELRSGASGRPVQSPPTSQSAGIDRAAANTVNIDKLVMRHTLTTAQSRGHAWNPAELPSIKLPEAVHSLANFRYGQYSNVAQARLRAHDALTSSNRAVLTAASNVNKQLNLLTRHDLLTTSQARCYSKMSADQQLKSQSLAMSALARAYFTPAQNHVLVPIKLVAKDRPKPK